jgi:hypothetical protein
LTVVFHYKLDCVDKQGVCQAEPKEEHFNLGAVDFKVNDAYACQDCGDRVGYCVD